MKLLLLLKVIDKNINKQKKKLRQSIYPIKKY